MTVDVKPAVKASLSVHNDLPGLKFNFDFQARWQAITDVSTRVVLGSNNKKIAVYQAGKLNATKLTDELLNTKMFPTMGSISYYASCYRPLFSGLLLGLVLRFHKPFDNHDRIYGYDCLA